MLSRIKRNVFYYNIYQSYLVLLIYFWFNKKIKLLILKYEIFTKFFCFVYSGSLLNLININNLLIKFKYFQLINSSLYQKEYYEHIQRWKIITL